MDEALQKFVAVVEAGTYTKAAEMLHLSQPALSVAIKKLEKNLGMKLLESSGRQGVVLTGAGQLAYATALEHRRVEQNLISELASLAGQRVPLRIGMIDSVAALLSGMPEQLHALETTTELSLHVAPSATLRREVLRSEIDLAIVVADDQADDRLEVAVTAADTLMLVGAPEAQAELQLQLNSHNPIPFLSYIRSSTTHMVIARALKRSGIKTETILYSTSPDVMLAMLLQRRSAAILPEALVKHRLMNGELTQLLHGGKPYEIQRRLHVVTLKGRKLPPRLAGLAVAMREQLKPYTIS